ncbi:MAG TPA: Ig domain-containing protein, partial [Dehalococcoidia bacterium]
SSGNFYWLSAAKPIVPPGTPFPIGETDLPAWIRNSGLEPDWLRVGTDIVGGGPAPTFNGAFSLNGVSGCSAISVAPATAPDATAGDPYSAAFSGSGGTAPYTLSSSGPLPPGLGFNTGTLSGTPMQAGAFTFSVTATDAHDCTGTTNVTLRVVAPGVGGGAKPVISSARLSPITFRAAAHGAGISRKRKPPVGTRLSYRDSEAATTTLAITRPAAGHKRGRKCVAGKPRRHQKRCLRYIKVGAFTHLDTAGKVTVHLSGRVHGRKLRPGRYRLTLTPRLAGSSGKSVRLSFKIASAK